METLNSILGALSRVSHAQLTDLSRQCGVPRGTLVRLKYKQTVNPRLETLEKLRRYFARRGS